MSKLVSTKLFSTKKKETKIKIGIKLDIVSVTFLQNTCVQHMHACNTYMYITHACMQHIHARNTYMRATHACDHIKSSRACNPNKLYAI